MTNKFSEIVLLAGDDDHDAGVFDTGVLQEAGLDNITISAALAKMFQPIANNFGPLMKDGRGVAIILSGGKIDITGIKAEEEQQ